VVVVVVLVVVARLELWEEVVREEKGCGSGWMMFEHDDEGG
jgi:hypothetical protein